MTVRVAIVGCGRIAGFFHVPILAGMSGARLAVLSDTDPDRLAQAMAGAPGAAGFANPEALMTDSGIDAVVLCVPPGLHAHLAKAAFAGGKHVYVEKPLALSAADGAEVAAAWRKAGTVGMIGFNFRFNPAYLDLKRRLKAQELGEILAVRTTFLSARRVLPDWKGAVATGGGALRDLGGHHLDLLTWLFDSPIQAVSAADRSRHTEADTAMLTVELTSGVAAQVLLSVSPGLSENRIEVIGGEGRLVAEVSRSTAGVLERSGGGRVARLRRAGAAALANLDPRAIRQAGLPEPSFAAALGAFVQAIAARSAVSPSIEDGQRSLLAVLAAERSIRSGRAEKPGDGETADLAA